MYVVAMSKRKPEEFVSAKLPSEDIRKLEELAAQGDRSRSAEVRRAVREYVERHATEKAAA